MTYADVIWKLVEKIIEQNQDTNNQKSQAND